MNKLRAVDDARRAAGAKTCIVATMTMGMRIGIGIGLGMGMGICGGGIAAAQEIAAGAAENGGAKQIAATGNITAVKEDEAKRVEMIERVYGSVVCIYGENPAKGGGSGVLIDPSGLTLTNFHVVKEAGDAGWAGLADERMYRWRLVGVDPGGDLAMIQLTGREDFPYSPLADSDLVKVGDRVMAMGNPFALAEDQTPSVSYGIVSGVHRYQEGEQGNMLVYGDCIQVDSSINPGNSGGPLFDMRGQVIGINGRGSFEERGRVNVGLGYAISANQARNFLGELLATKVAQHATLDATFEDRDGKVIATAIDLERCPLAKLGMQPGDRLVSFDGKLVEHANQLTRWLTTLPAGWSVAVTWERGGKRGGGEVVLNALAYGKGETPRIRMRLPLKERRNGSILPVDFEMPAGMAGVIENIALNQELAMMLVRRCDELRDAGVTEAVIVGSTTVDGTPGLLMRLTVAEDMWYVALTSDLQQPAVLMTDWATVDENEPVHQAQSDGVIERSQRKCVKIFGAGIGREHGYATGLLVSEDGLILAAQGVYLDGQRIRVVTADGNSYAADVVKRDATSQLALLKIDTSTPEYWKIDGDARTQPVCETGDWVYAISNVFKVAEGSEALSVTLGVVSMRATLDTKKRAQDFDVAGDVLLIDAITANPGAPGGAVVNCDGQLVGMIGKTLTAKATNTWLNYAIPVDRLAKFMHGDDQPAQVEPVAAAADKPGELGIRIFTQGGRRGPAYIDNVMPGSAAANAGLKKDDLVLSVGDQWIRNVQEYEAWADKLKAGQKLVMTVKRGRELVQVTITAEEKK